MQRRTLLRTIAGAGAAGLLVACGDQMGMSPAAPQGASPGPADPVRAVAPDAEPVLSLLSGSFEQLTGPGRPFAFGLVGPENEPVTGAEVDLWVVPLDGGQPQGPHRASFREVPGQPLGLYIAQVDITAPGATYFVAVTQDGRAGSDAIEVATPETSKAPAPGSKALSVPTPTAANPMGFQRLCTSDPACGMHETSLDQDLAAGRPVMLMFATPLYCQTAVCGPSVSVLDQVRTSRDWGDLAFVHVEIYTDAGQSLAPPVQQWRLPSEPWVFAIGRDGTIADRADGPLLTLSDQVAAIAERVSA
jgi:hypothetical protein